MLDFRLPSLSRWECPLLCCYAACSGDSLPTFQETYLGIVDPRWGQYVVPKRR